MLLLTMLITLTVYSIACMGIGTIILRAISNDDLTASAGTKLASAFLLGQGLLANLWVILASTGTLAPVIVKTIVYIFFTIGLLLAHKLFSELQKQVITVYHEFQKESRGWKVLIVLALTTCLVWITALGRSPIGDGSGFYLALAKVTAASGRLAPLPGYEELTSIGLQGEMHFAALMSMGSPESTELFTWLTIMAGSIMLLALARSAGMKRRGQWLVLAMLFTSSTMIELSGSGKTDLYATALGFAAYYWAFRIPEGNGRTAAVLAGIFCGLALVAKISYILTFIPGIAILLVRSAFLLKADRQRSTSILSLSVLFIAAGLLAVLPHFFKNYMVFDNPLAPFNTGGLVHQTWYGPETTRQILLTLPLALTFGRYWAQMGNITPLVLCFSPLILFIPKPRNFLQSPLVIITLAALLGLACWFAFRPAVLAPRYFMACLLLLIVPAAKSAEYFSSLKIGSKAGEFLILCAAIVAMISSGLYYSRNIFIPKQAYLFLSGKLPDCEVEPRYCGRLTTINQTLEPGERLFSNDYLRYWLRADLIQCALNTEETNTYLNLKSSEQRWGFIYGRGFRKVLVINTGNPLANLIREDLNQIPAWLNIDIKADNYVIYLRLTSLDPYRKPVLGCMQTAPPAWDLPDISSLK